MGSYIKYHDKADFQTIKNLLTDCIYLEDSSVELFGYKIYGSPWTIWRLGNAFQRCEEGFLASMWKFIPNDTEILVTHSPPNGHGDEPIRFPGLRVGCTSLIDEVHNRIKPLYHIFGHIHEGHGVSKEGTTTFINASSCNKNGDPVNLPVVFDLPLKISTE